MSQKTEERAVKRVARELKKLAISPQFAEKFPNEGGVYQLTDFWSCINTPTAVQFFFQGEQNAAIEVIKDVSLDPGVTMGELTGKVLFHQGEFFEWENLEPDNSTEALFLSALMHVLLTQLFVRSV